jgi:hypothetical protein
MMESSKKSVYTVIDSDKLQRPLFRRIGVAFVNADQSLNVLLDAFPVNGRLHIRAESPRRSEQTSQGGTPVQEARES